MKYKVSMTGLLTILAMTLGFTVQAAPVVGVGPLPAIAAVPTTTGSQPAPLVTVATIPASTTAQPVPAIPAGAGAADVEIGDDINEVETPDVEGVEVAEIETPDIETPDIEVPEIEAPEIETPELGE